jgi:hypothetical protein
VIALVRNVTGFVKQKYTCRNRLSVNMLTLQDAELQLLDKLQQKILLSQQAIGSTIGENNIFDSLKVFESFTIDTFEILWLRDE